MTIAVAPRSRANSTSRSVKISTSTLSRSAVASARNAWRSSGVNSVFGLRDRAADDADDHPVEDPRGAPDDVEMAVGDRVVAARADRRSARRSSSPPLRVDPDQRLADAALATRGVGSSSSSGRRAELSSDERAELARGAAAGVARAAAQGGRRVYTADRRRRGRSVARAALQVADRVRAHDLAAVRRVPSASTLRARQRRARVDQHRRSAPRESASIASAPVPQKRSRTRAPSRRRRGSRTASRARGRRSAARPSTAAAARPACGRRARPATTLTPAIGSARSSPNRCAGGVEQRAELRGVERPVLATEQRRAPRARASASSARVVGQLGDPEARQPVLAGAEDLALAAQRQVDLGELEAVAARARSPPSAAARARTRDRRTGCTGSRARPARPARAAGAAARARSARRPRSASRSRSATSIPTSITVVATRTSARPARTPPSPPPSRATASGRAAGRPRSRANSPAAQPLGLGVGRLRLQLLGVGDQRADDVGLAALAQPLADELVGAGALRPPRRPRS